MITDGQTLGELLKHARRAAGLTQEALAARSGLSARAISDLERNVNHAPRSTTIQLLVSALSLSDAERELFEAAARMERALVESSRAGVTESSQAPLIGRTAERARLEQHLAGDHPRLLVLSGEPGVGKTRLLQEAAALASARGLHVVQGTVPASGHAGIRDPLVDALRQTIHSRTAVHLRRDLQGCAWLVRVVPELALGPIQALPPVSLPAEEELALTVRAVCRYLTNIAGPAGTLITLDNLHYSDAGAFVLLASLARAATDVPLRIIGAYRDSESTRGDALSSFLANLAHEQLVRHIALRPLSTHAAAEMLLATVKDRGAISAACVERVARETGGVPFYVAAWAHDLNLLGIEPADEYVPWAIRHSVRHRIDTATAAIRPVLEAMVAAGGRASYPLLVALTGQPEDAVLAALESAARERLIEEDGHTYAFAYDAIRRVVEADLSNARRLRLRRRLAAVVPRDLHDSRAGGPPAAERSAIAADIAERAHHLAVLRRHRLP